MKTKLMALAVALIITLLATFSFATPAQACGCGIPLKILPIGDSITRGVGSSNTSGYRVELQQRLKAAGMRVDFVGSQRDGGPSNFDLNHEGHGGWTLQQMTQSVKGWMATYKPDVVLVHAGTNDVIHNQPDMAARLNYLLRLIQAARPGVKIFVMQIIGIDGSARQAKVNAYNRAIPTLKYVKKPGVYVVNQTSVWGANLYDGVHPNDYGYQKMAFNIYMKMRQVYSANRWPVGNNPYAAWSARLCFKSSGCWMYYRNGSSWIKGERV